MMFGGPNIEEELRQRFVCAKCRSAGADVRSLAMTGTGLSRLLDFQHNEYIFASCRNCGYTEVYSQDILNESRSRGMDILDILFGH
jgi:predicted nucleic-acid-binding Zn-ribbon protein